MHFTCRTFIGSTSPDFWSQYWENEPDDPTLVQNRGHLFGLISLSDSDNPDLKSIGRQIISDLDSAYYSPEYLTLSLPLALKESLTQVLNSHSDKSYQLSLQILIIHKSIAYFLIYQSGQIVFARSSTVSTFSKISTTDNFQIFSGPVLNDDKIFLATPTFIDQITWDVIKTNLLESKIQTIEEDFLSRLYSADNQKHLAAALIIVHSPDSPPLSDDIPLSPPVTVSSPPPSPVKSFPKLNLFTKAKPFISRLIKPRSLYVNQSLSPQSEKRKKINLIIAVTLLIALIASSVFAYHKNQLEQNQKKYQSLKIELENKIKEAQNIKNLNLETAQEHARQAQDILSQLVLLELFPQETDRFKNEIDTLLSQTGSAESFQPESFYNTSIINQQASYHSLRLYGETLYLLDKNNHRLDSLNLATKSTQNISRDETLSQVLYFAKDIDNYFFITPESLYQLSGSDLTDQLSLSDISPNIIVGDLDFWNSSAYILDTGNNLIWRLPPSANGFSTPTKWLKDNQKLPQKPISMAINGKIWILSQSGEIIPYLQGNKDTYQNPLTAELSSANHLVTTPDTDILAFSTKDNQIYILNKEGQSIAQYNFDQLEILDLAINQQGSQLYVLCADQHLYRIFP